MSSSTTENSSSPPEPLRLKLYGFWSMSFPTYLVMQFGSFVLLGILLVGSYEILHPVTGFGKRLHDLLEKEPDVLEILSWGPPALLLIGALELCETVVTLFLFRREWRKISMNSSMKESQ